MSDEHPITPPTPAEQRAADELRGLLEGRGGRAPAPVDSEEADVVGLFEAAYRREAASDRAWERIAGGASPSPQRRPWRPLAFAAAVLFSAGVVWWGSSRGGLPPVPSPTTAELATAGAALSGGADPVARLRRLQGVADTVRVRLLSELSDEG